MTKDQFSLKFIEFGDGALIKSSQLEIHISRFSSAKGEHPEVT